MTFSPEIQMEINKLLLILIPALGTLFGAFVTWAVANLRQNHKDNTMLHEAKRVLEGELGVKTTWNPETRRFDVSRPGNPVSQNPTPQDPQGNGEGQGPAGAA